MQNNIALENFEKVFISLNNKFHSTNSDFVLEIENIFYEINNLKNIYIDKNLEVDKILNELEKEKDELKKKNDELEEFKKVSFISSIHKRLEDKDRQISIIQQKYNNLEKKYNILESNNNKFILESTDKKEFKNNKKIEDNNKSISYSENDLNSSELKVSENSDSCIELKIDMMVDTIKNNKEIVKQENTIINENDIEIVKHENPIINENTVNNKFSDKDNNTIKNKDIINNDILNNTIVNDTIVNDNKSNIEKDNDICSVEDFEAELENGKIYLFSMDDSGSKFFYKKLKNGNYSKKISGKWSEDSNGELIIEEL